MALTPSTFPYTGGDKKKKLNLFIYANKTKIKFTVTLLVNAPMALEYFYLKHSNLWKRDKPLKSNERKTIGETCKMKKATCAQFKVYERNLTFTVVISP